MLLKREYPDQPLVGVGGVTISKGSVLLIRRAQEPLRGEWSIPGGMLHLGEALKDGVRRELKEETGLRVEPVSVLGVFDRIFYGEESDRVKYHYVLVDYLCCLLSGELCASSDASQARWVSRERISGFHLNKETKALVERAFQKEEQVRL